MLLEITGVKMLRDYSLLGPSAKDAEKKAGCCKVVS